MSNADPSRWSELLETTLARYREPLLRQVVARFLKPRSQWPCQELVERCLAAVRNAAVIDRRLQDLDPSGRQIMALIAHSRQPRWRLGSLVEIGLALGHADGIKPVLALLESGLLYPCLPETLKSLASFEEWLGQAGGEQLQVFAHPLIAGRALGEPLPLPDFASAASPVRESVVEADGLEWPLRLAVIWQSARTTPFRRTLQGDFFKRDLDRLRQDAVLSRPPADSLMELPDPAMLAVSFGLAENVLTDQSGELQARQLPEVWEEGLALTLASLFAALPVLTRWNPLEGAELGPMSIGHPFSSAYLLVLLALAHQPADQWFHPGPIQEWLDACHPYWTSDGLRPSRRQPWVATFLLGPAYQLRLVEAAKDENNQGVVRLSAMGRWLLGQSDHPPALPHYGQTLLVQPNLEVVAYRQGLTPALIAQLSQFASWKSLGSACTLQLEPEAVYRALESGESFETICQTLEKHGMRPMPQAVVEALRTWSNKRERLSVYADASLLEFATADDLNDALARGVPAMRLTDRLALVAQDDDIDFRHFRLVGTRDYSLPPERCVHVEEDGVTLVVDVTKSDLLLETELPRFAERFERAAEENQRYYRMTPETLAMARSGGFSMTALESWFRQRAGQPLPPSARLFFLAGEVAPAHLTQLLILQLTDEDAVDGLMQWPETRPLIHERLGPLALVVEDAKAPLLLGKLREIGLRVDGFGSATANGSGA